MKHDRRDQETEASDTRPPGPRPRILVVGELNPFGTDPRFALYPRPRTSSGNRLREIMGLSDVAYLRLLDRMNLCSVKWFTRLARATWEKTNLSGYDLIILLGQKVRSATNGPPPFEQGRLRRDRDEEYLTLGLPHPSGLSRAWNESGTRGRALAALRLSAPWMPWGMTDVEEEHHGDV